MGYLLEIEVELGHDPLLLLLELQLFEVERGNFAGDLLVNLLLHHQTIAGHGLLTLVITAFAIIHRRLIMQDWLLQLCGGSRADCGESL